jgi:preprotein translocase subunit SecG
MSALTVILLVIHILVSIALILIILAQTSKGGGLDSNLGGAAANVFGSGASDMLKKWTQIIGTVFLLSCVFLAINVKSGATATGLDSSNEKAVKEIPAETTDAPAEAEAPVEANTVNTENNTK